MATMSFGAVILPTMALGQPDDLEVYGTMPSFRMTDQTGAEVTETALAGHVVIANFVFTRCPTVCPLLTMKMRRVQDRTSDVPDRIKLVSFSVDPEYDSPEVLAEYAAGHGADPKRWRFLTGDADDARRIATDGLMLALDVQGRLPNGAPDIVHAEHFVLFDQAMQIRGYYDAGDPKRIERMVQDAYRLLKREDRGRGDRGD
ncbi:SCO family protein [Haliangium sp.]|uniref:SCO family protein n=1 Tax=Haliangium sp. TaxID=2663208 RepID=UPI003D0F2C4B